MEELWICGDCCYWNGKTEECHRNSEAWFKMNYGDGCSRWEAGIEVFPLNKKGKSE